MDRGSKSRCPLFVKNWQFRGLFVCLFLWLRIGSPMCVAFLPRIGTPAPCPAHILHGDWNNPGEFYIQSFYWTTLFYIHWHRILICFGCIHFLFAGKIMNTWNLMLSMKTSECNYIHTYTHTPARARVAHTRTKPREFPNLHSQVIKQ
jgi:hypothetical protein